MRKSQEDDYVELNNEIDYSDYLLFETTKVNEDYLFGLKKKNIIKYEQVFADDYKLDTFCYLTSETTNYLKQLISKTNSDYTNSTNQINELKLRINEILTFDPEKLSNEIKSIDNIINDTKKQLSSNPILQPLTKDLDVIETHFKSLSIVANNYEQVYKNIILPVKEEGKSGVKQTVKWAIVSIIASTVISTIISWIMKS